MSLNKIAICSNDAVIAQGTNPEKALALLPRIRAVGTGVTSRKYTQEEVLQAFQITDRRIRSVFTNSWIKERHLSLPTLEKTPIIGEETQGQLLHKHTKIGLEMGSKSILRCLERSQAKLSDIRHLCCVTSTGFITPGFSALLIKELGLRRDCSRLDVVGMGCNAGLNALSAVTSWSQAHPKELALMVCIEVCSAAYVFDGSMRTAVVNSLFGDGAAALSVTANEKESSYPQPSPTIVRFASYLIPEAIDAMCYDWDDSQNKFSFFLDPQVPYVIGAHAVSALKQLLAGTSLHLLDIKHWIIHAGGKKVIDSVRINLGLTRHDMRHTISVLQDYGNVSSGSFLFSYERLLQEGTIAPGDYGVMMTMGPGSTIELALLHWTA